MKRFFAIDLRSLFVFRIALGTLLLIDLIDRARDLTAHYTDLGVLPREAMTTLFRDPLRWSLHSLGGSPAFEALLFSAAALFALLLICNRWTRLATLASWILLVSVQHRNVFVLYGGDLFLRSMLFWAIFLPWNEPFFRRKKTVSSPATAALLLQVVFVYFFSGLLKAKDPSWLEGQGVYYALALDTYVRPLGTWLLGFPRAIHWLSYATLGFELGAPLLLLFTFRTPRLRLATIAAFFFFQAGLASCLSLGLFPWICTAATLPFLPSLFWEKCLRVAPSSSDARIERLPWPVKSFVLLSLGFALLWNIAAVVPLSFPKALWIWPRAFALNQTWIMFVSPRITDGWYVIPGRLADGSEVDLFQGRSRVIWSRPQSVSGAYKNLRWSKYMSNVWDMPPLRPYLAWFLCHRWNGAHSPEKRLEDIEIDYQLEMTRSDDPRPPPEKIVLDRYTCREAE